MWCTACSAGEVTCDPPERDPDNPQPVVIEAPVIEKLDSVIRAYGGVLVTQGARRMRASSATYDLETQTGSLWDAVFTTCSRDRPEYRLESRRVELLPGDRLRVHRASVYMGNTRLITLPTIGFRVGSRAGSRMVFPRVGYDSFEGVSLAQSFKLRDTDRLQTTADVRVTTRNGLQGEGLAVYGVDGVLLDFPGKALDCDALRYRSMSIPDEPGALVSGIRLSEAARLRLHTSISRRQRVYDIDEKDLQLSRRPEIGLTHTGKQISFSRSPLDPRLEMYPVAEVAWGRYDETPGVRSASRVNAGVVLPVNFLDLGAHTAVQPVFSYAVSRYSGGDTYRVWTCALDAARTFGSGAHAAVRIIRRFESGITPFEFDDVDVRREVQAAVRSRISRHVVGFALNYDIDRHRAYEWEAFYAYRTDCLLRALRWNNRLKRLTVDFALINL